MGTDGRGCLHITAAASNFERIQTNDIVDLIEPDSPVGQVRFRLLGRADSIINSGGVKVQPEAVERIIEATLASWGLTPRLFVAGVPDERLGQRVVLFLESVSLSTDQWRQLQEAIQTAVGPYAVPKQQVTVAAFAETATAKIDRKRIVTSYLSDMA